MTKRSLTASLMLSTLLLTAITPTLGATADTTSSSVATSSSSTVKALSSHESKVSSSQKESIDKKDSDSTIKGSNAITIKTDEPTDTKKGNDKIQTLTEQTMVLKKIIAKAGSVKSTVGTAGINDAAFKGVNGSTFKVYDVTDLMNTIIKEDLKTDSKVDANAKTIDKAVDNTEAQLVDANKDADATTSDSSSASGSSVIKDYSSTSATKNGSSESSNTSKSMSILPIIVPNDTKSSTRTTSGVKAYLARKNSSSSSKESNSDKASDSTNSTFKKGETSKDSSDKSSTDSKPTAATSTSDSSNVKATDDALAAKINELMSNDSLRKKVADRASKFDSGQLKTVATVKTAHDDKLNSDGVASVKLPIDGKYHAYYVVNTDTPKADYVTNAEPIVVFTPVTKDDGMYANSFTIYPKSDNIAKPTTPQKQTSAQNQPLQKVTSAPMYQTGTTQGHGIVEKLIAAVWNLF